MHGDRCYQDIRSFEWAPGTPAVAADEATGQHARPATPAESKHDLDQVFKKFDHHLGVQRYRSIKRQEFLDTKRKPNQGIMDLVAKLKLKAEHCDYGVDDERCSERLLDLPDHELTLHRVSQICRQAELMKAHLKTISSLR